jgi:hypothetical protein
MKHVRNAITDLNWKATVMLKLNAFVVVVLNLCRRMYVRRKGEVSGVGRKYEDESAQIQFCSKRTLFLRELDFCSSANILAM